MKAASKLPAHAVIAVVAAAVVLTSASGCDGRDDTKEGTGGFRDFSVVDEATNVGDGPARVAVGQGAVWVINAREMSVARIDPQTRRLTGNVVQLDARPSDIAAGADGVWVTSEKGGELLRIDPKRGRVVKRFQDEATG